MGVILTRPTRDSERLAKIFCQRGIKTILSPLLSPKLRPLEASKVQGDVICIATSQYALPALLPTFSKKALLVVGDHTANQALKLGFQDVVRAGDTVRELLAYITLHISVHTFLFYARGRNISFPISRALSERGYVITEQIVYEMQEVAELKKAAIEALQHSVPYGVCLFSTRSASIFEALISAAHLSDHLHNHLLIGFSKNISDKLLHFRWRNVLWCKKPSLVEFWQLIENHQGLLGGGE